VQDPAPELRREKMNKLVQESQERKLEMHSFLREEEKKEEVFDYFCGGGGGGGWRRK
jgi:hypothetical protein